jgi:hypothetical protein
MTTISLRLPDEIHARVAAAAEADHISINSALVQAAQVWLDAHLQRAKARAMVDRIIAEDAELLGLLDGE